MTTALIILIVFCLCLLRAKVVMEAYKEWNNYFMYRYRKYCELQYSQDEKPSCRIEENELTRAEAVLVFLIFWKIDSQFFFQHKPDWEEIHEKYILRKDE